MTLDFIDDSTPFNVFYIGGNLDHFGIEFDNPDARYIEILSDDWIHVFPTYGSFIKIKRLSNNLTRIDGVEEDDEINLTFKFSNIEFYQSLSGRNFLFYKNRKVYLDSKFEREILSNARKLWQIRDQPSWYGDTGLDNIVFP